MLNRFKELVANRHIGSSVVTSKEVAARAKVSVATVSLVLNNKPSVGAETRARVLACIEELGYRPNIVARSFKTSSTKAISVLVPTITNPVYPNIVHGIEGAARREGYQVMLCCYAGEPELATKVDCLSDLYDRMVDGIIICGIPTMPDDRHHRRAVSTMSHFIDRGTPFVFLSDDEQLTYFAERYEVDLSRHGELFHVLTVNREQAAYSAVNHLALLGHKRIALVAEDTRGMYPHNIPFLRKLAGYRRALEASGLSFDESLIVGGESEYQGGEQCFVALSHMADPPTAAFCTASMTTGWAWPSTRGPPDMQ